MLSDCAMVSMELASPSSPSSPMGIENCGPSPYRTPKRAATTPLVSKRSLSFQKRCENGEDDDTVLKDISNSIIPASVTPKCLYDPDNCAQPLPLISGSHPDLNCITPETVPQFLFHLTQKLCNLLDGHFSSSFDHVYVLDCRFDYEYNGGHVKGATNMPAHSTELLRSLFIQAPILNKRVAFVFYCEFSSKRGPSSCRQLRKMDREANVESYPSIYYPYTYVLEGGYKNFYETCRHRCVPQGYVEMKDKRYCTALKENFKELRQQSWKRSRSLDLTGLSARLKKKPLSCSDGAMEITKSFTF